MKRYLLPFLLFGSWFWGCDDVVETDIIQIDEKIFILGLISPENDSISVNISRTLPSLGLELSFDNPEDDAQQFIERNATVTIESASGNSMPLPFLDEELQYAESTENFEIVPGETYTLRVLVDGESYSAQCTVPLENIASIQEQIRRVESEFQSTEYDLDVGFNDVQNTDNFYLVGALLDVENQDDIFFNSTRGISFELEAFQTDNLRDGSSIVASTSFFPALFFDENNEIQFPDQDLVMQVINAEQVLFELLRADYLNDVNEDDPFIELSIFPNNITGEGGTGVFAGYRYFEKRIALEEE